MAKVSKTIVLLPGDGIGPEVISAAADLLRDTASAFGHRFTLEEFPIGGAAIDSTGRPLPAETVAACRRADAALLGAVGGPRWDSLPLDRRPEAGLLGIRKELGLAINLRPICLREPLRENSPLKAARTHKIDLEIVRELAGGMYFGERGSEDKNGGERAWDVESYTSAEIERIARFALARAERRRGALASVDKANVLASSALWRRTVTRLAAAHPQVRLEHLYVDNAAMQLVLAPQQFDVLLTSNMFGDILSDAAAGLVGSIGLIPSMSCAPQGPLRSPAGAPLFEPIHGSAPSLAGRDAACPIGAILCAALLLREAFSLDAEAAWIEAALDRTLFAGFRTADIATPQTTTVGCSRFTSLVRDEMCRLVQQFEPYGWGV